MENTMKRNITIFLMLALFGTGCSENGVEPGYNEQVVVSAYLYTGQPIDSVKLSRTFGIHDQYTSKDAAVSGAKVTISTEDQMYALKEYANKKGAYYLPDTSVKVLAGETYQLEVKAGDHELYAETTAPEPVRISELNADTLEFLDEQKRFILQWRNNSDPAGYLISTRAIPEPEPPYIDRLGDFKADGIVDFQLAQFDGDTLKAFNPQSSYGMAGLETSAELPWFMFSWYGEYQVNLYAMNKELMDVLTGGQGNTLEPLKSNISGGLGIFTAVSMDTVRVFVRR